MYTMELLLQSIQRCIDFYWKKDGGVQGKVFICYLLYTIELLVQSIQLCIECNWIRKWTTLGGVKGTVFICYEYNRHCLLKPGAILGAKFGLKYLFCVKMNIC